MKASLVFLELISTNLAVTTRCKNGWARSFKAVGSGSEKPLSLKQQGYGALELMEVRLSFMHSGTIFASVEANEWIVDFEYIVEG